MFVHSIFSDPHVPKVHRDVPRRLQGQQTNRKKTYIQGNALKFSVTKSISNLPESLKESLN